MKDYLNQSLDKLSEMIEDGIFDDANDRLTGMRSRQCAAIIDTLFTVFPDKMKAWLAGDNDDQVDTSWTVRDLMVQLEAARKEASKHQEQAQRFRSEAVSLGTLVTDLRKQNVDQLAQINEQARTIRNLNKLLENT